MSTAPDLSTLRAGWERYARAMIPPDASPAEWLISRRAFYAGCAHCFSGLANTSQMTDAQINLRADVYEAELDQITDEAREGRG